MSPGPEACVIVAHDAETGEELWRRLVRRGEPSDETWGDVPYEDRVHVGSWTAPSVDLDLNLVFFDTSVTSPAPKFLRDGIENTHLYHNSTLALDADPARSAGYYQHLHDDWDLYRPFKRQLVDTAVAPDPTPSLGPTPVCSAAPPGLPGRARERRLVDDGHAGGVQQGSDHRPRRATSPRGRRAECGGIQPVRRPSPTAIDISFP